MIGSKFPDKCQHFATNRAVYSCNA